MDRVERHEIETLRRSLAIGNGLPPSQIHRLLATCDELYEHAATIRAELDALRPVITELRQRLTAIEARARR